MMKARDCVLDPDKHGNVEMRGNAEDRSLRKIIRMIDSNLTGSEFFMGGLATFEPGVKAPLHDHPDAEEINVVVEGEGLFITDQGTQPIKPGDWQFIPKGVPHSHENTGDTPLTIIWVYSPPTSTIPK